MPLQKLLEKIVRNHGYLNGPDVDELAKLDRMHQVCVRCNAARFTCPVQCCAHLCTIIGESGKDWVRDVSLLSTDPALQTYAHVYGVPEPTPVLVLSGVMIVVPLGDEG